MWYHYFAFNGGALDYSAEISHAAHCSSSKPMMTGMAHLGHLVIYLLFIVLPVIGLVMMYNRGNPWVAFGITMPHAAEANFELVDMLKSRHVTLANLGYFVIGLHAIAALIHHYFWKDNTLLRMMPRKRD